MTTLFSYNVGDNSRGRIADIVTLLREVRADVVCLCEAGWVDDDATVRALKGDTGLSFSAIARSPAGGSHLLLLSRYPLGRVKTGEGFKNAGLVAEVHTDNGPVDIVAVHLAPSPESARVDELKEILSHCESDGRPIVIMGDLNAITRGEPVDYEVEAGGNDQPTVEAVSYELTDMLRQMGFADVGLLASEKFLPTVPLTRDGRVVYRNLRLDYFFVSEAIKDKVADYAVIVTPETTGLSDHSPITVRLNF